MLFQKPYHHPYIPQSPPLSVPQAPYVGGELAFLTSKTPFYRGQGIALQEQSAPVHKAVSYGFFHDKSSNVVTGSDGWATYLWDKGKGEITYTKSGVTKTVKSGTSAYTAITTQVKTWTPVSGGSYTAPAGGPGTVPQSTTANQGGQQPKQGGGMDWLTGITSAITGFTSAVNPQQQVNTLPAAGAVQQQGMSTGTIVGLGIAGLVGFGILVAVLAKD